MYQFILKKGFEALATLFCVATLVFILMHNAPGSPFVDEHLLNSDALKALNAHYGLDKPLFIQYIHYIKSLACGDLGPSLTIEGACVSSLIKQAFPLSLVLGACALFFSLFFGLILSLWLVFSKSRFAKKVGHFINTSCLALPSFIGAILLQYFLAIKWKLFPATGYHTPLHLILPALSICFIPTGIIARLLKTKIESSLQLPYMLSAKSKGLPFFRFLSVHLLPSALLPTLSYLGPLAATLITGSFACEKVFALPGLGSWFVISLSNRDYPLIAGLTLFYTLFVVGFSFLVDLLYTLFDPKLKGEIFDASI